MMEIKCFQLELVTYRVSGLEGASTVQLQLPWSKDRHLLAGKHELQVLPSRVSNSLERPVFYSGDSQTQTGSKDWVSGNSGAACKLVTNKTALGLFSFLDSVFPPGKWGKLEKNYVVSNMI